MPQHTPIIIIILTIAVATLFLLITFKSPELIGFTHGPSAQLFATKQQQFIQSKLNLLRATTSTSTTTAAATSWANRIQTAASYYQIYNPHYESAYLYQQKQNDNTTYVCILRDAGVFAAMVGVLRAQQKQKQQTQRMINCIYQLVMTVALFILPGMLGQVFISKTIPIEMVILWNHFDSTDDANTNNNDVSSILSRIVEGIVYVGYCSLKSVVLGIGSVMYELKVVGVALAFVAAFVVGDGA